MGGGVRKAGFTAGGGVELSFTGFCKIAACVNSGVTLTGLRGVENASFAVEESCESCALIASSGRDLVLNCSLNPRICFATES